MHSRYFYGQPEVGGICFASGGWGHGIAQVVPAQTYWLMRLSLLFKIVFY